MDTPSPLEPLQAHYQSPHLQSGLLADVATIELHALGSGVWTRCVSCRTGGPERRRKRHSTENRTLLCKLVKDATAHMVERHLPALESMFGVWTRESELRLRGYLASYMIRQRHNWPDAANMADLARQLGGQHETRRHAFLIGWAVGKREQTDAQERSAAAREQREQQENQRREQAQTQARENASVRERVTTVGELMRERQLAMEQLPECPGCTGASEHRASCPLAVVDALREAREAHGTAWADVRLAQAMQALADFDGFASGPDK
jgi:hypothetical protein